MNINLEKVTRAMLSAVRTEIADRWPSARTIAEGELRKLAGTFAQVQRMLANGETDLAGARALIRMQENSARSILRTVEGISVLTSRRVVSAALGAAASIVNPAIGALVILGERSMTNRNPETPASSSSKPDSKPPAAAATRRARAVRTSTVSSEPAEDATPSFKAGRDL